MNRGFNISIAIKDKDLERMKELSEKLSRTRSEVVRIAVKELSEKLDNELLNKYYKDEL